MDKFKLIKRIKCIDWKYVKHWLKCSIEDIPEGLWYLIRFHYIAIISMVVSIYFYPLLFFETGDWINVVIGAMILFLGVGFDISRNNRGLC